MRRERVITGMALLLACALLIPAAANAQMMDEKAGNISIGYLMPSIDGMSGGVFNLGYTRKMSGGKTLEVYLPFAMASPDGFDSENALGNPYLGLNMKKDGSDMSLFGGVSLPLAPDDKPFGTSMGALADMTNPAAFSANYLGIHAGAAWEKPNEGGLGLWYGVGPTIMVQTKDTGGDSSEIFVNFWGGGFYPVSSVNVGAGISGTYWATAGDGPDALIYQAILGAMFQAGPTNVGVTLRLPLSNQWSDAVSSIIGVNVGIPIK